MGRHVAPLTARGSYRGILAAVVSLAMLVTALGFGIFGGDLNGPSGQGNAAGVDPPRPAPTVSTDPDDSDESGSDGESDAGGSTRFPLVGHPLSERSAEGERTDASQLGSHQRSTATPTAPSGSAGSPADGDSADGDSADGDSADGDPADPDSDAPSSPAKPSDTPTTPSPTPSESNAPSESPSPEDGSSTPTQESSTPTQTPTEGSPTQTPTESPEPEDEPDEEPEPTSSPDAPGEENVAVELATQKQGNGKVVTRVRIVNDSEEPLSWTVGLTYDTVEVDQSWQAEVSASGGEVMANGVGENAEIEPGGHAQFGYIADGEPAQPRACTLNGAECRVQ